MANGRASRSSPSAADSPRGRAASRSRTPYVRAVVQDAHTHRRARSVNVAPAAVPIAHPSPAPVLVPEEDLHTIPLPPDVGEEVIVVDDPAPPRLVAENGRPENPMAPEDQEVFDAFEFGNAPPDMHQAPRDRDGVDEEAIGRLNGRIQFNVELLVRLGGFDNLLHLGALHQINMIICMDCLRNRGGCYFLRVNLNGWIMGILMERYRGDFEINRRRQAIGRWRQAHAVRRGQRVQQGQQEMWRHAQMGRRPAAPEPGNAHDLGLPQGRIIVRPVAESPEQEIEYRCPVCLDTATRRQMRCSSCRNSVCLSCVRQLTNCPMCREAYTRE